MVQAAPNESRVTGVLRAQRPDPQRPGFVVLDLSVGSSDSGSGPQLSALAPGQDVEVVARQSLVEALPHGVALPVTATVRMAGPGIYVARDLQVDPSAGPVIGSPARIDHAVPAGGDPAAGDAGRGGGAGTAGDAGPKRDGAKGSSRAGLRGALRSALTAAMKAQDTLAVSAIRSALAAIDNAEAVPVQGAGAGVGAWLSTAPPGPVGAGASDVPRRELSEADIDAIVAAEIGQLRQAADEVAPSHPHRAAQLRTQAEVLTAIARSTSSGSR